MPDPSADSISSPLGQAKPGDSAKSSERDRDVTEPSVDDSDIAAWIDSLRNSDGDDAAAFELWRHCMPQMIERSRRRLPPNLRRAIDEEDIALSAFYSLCDGLHRGEFSELDGVMDLLRLVTCITDRKTKNHIKHATRLKRGGGTVRGESVFGTLNEQATARRNASPDWIAEQLENYEARLNQLDDPALEAIAILRLEGYTVEEIARRIGCVPRTVERRLSLIRQIWLDTEPTTSWSPSPSAET